MVNLKGLNQSVKVEHFKMVGLHLLPDVKGLDGEVRSKGSISLSLHPSRPSKVPPSALGLWAYIHTYQANPSYPFYNYYAA